MRTGWQLVIEGRHFSPGNFFGSSIIKPSDIKLGVITFDDWHSDPYPLDIATEALDFLSTHETELISLLAFPGIETKTLNFVDSLTGHGGSFKLSHTQLILLGRLGIDVDITVMPDQTLETARRGIGNPVT